VVETEMVPTTARAAVVAVVGGVDTRAAAERRALRAAVLAGAREARLTGEAFVAALTAVERIARGVGARHGVGAGVLLEMIVIAARGEGDKHDAS